MVALTVTDWTLCVAVVDMRWDGKEREENVCKAGIGEDGIFGDILVTKANECFDNIPEDVQYMIKELDKM
jgi:hypothetical protein